MTGTEYAVIAAVIFLAACLQASTGFGMGMLAAPVLAIVDPTLLPATLILLALLVTVLVTIRERQHLDLRGAGWALVGRIPGSLLGAWLVAALSKEGLAWVVVVVVLSGLVLAVRGWSTRAGPAEPRRCRRRLGRYGHGNVHRRTAHGPGLARPSRITPAGNDERVLYGRFGDFPGVAGSCRRRDN